GAGTRRRGSAHVRGGHTAPFAGAAAMRARVLVAALLAACASSRPVDPMDAARTRDMDAVEMAKAEIEAMPPSRFVVVEMGRVTAAAMLPDDAVRAAEKKDASTLHRFVFRPLDLGARQYRLAYIAEGGIVLGRRFVTDLGLE